jgi:hypothetical protein
MTGVTIEQAAAAILDLLRTAPGLDVFDGEVKAKMDSDGKAHPYAVLWAGPGRDNPAETRESDTGRALVWAFQVTAAGGDVARCRRAVTRTLGVLLNVRPFPDGGLIKLDFDPGTEREDRDVQPTRWYVPLAFVLSLP